MSCKSPWFVKPFHGCRNLSLSMVVKMYVCTTLGSSGRVPSNASAFPCALSIAQMHDLCSGRGLRYIHTSFGPPYEV